MLDVSKNANYNSEQGEHKDDSMIQEENEHVVGVHVQMFCNGNVWYSRILNQNSVIMGQCPRIC